MFSFALTNLTLLLACMPYMESQLLLTLKAYKPVNRYMSALVIQPKRRQLYLIIHIHS